MTNKIFTVLLLVAFVASFINADEDHLSALKNGQRILKDSFLQELANEAFTSGSFQAASSKGLMDTSSYSLTGFVFTNYFYNTESPSDMTCSDQTQAVMYPVNYCHSNGTYNVKLQIKEDSCSTGLVQYFADTACTDFIGTSSLDGYDACAPTKNNKGAMEGTMRTVTCSTSASPYIDDTFGYTEEYVGDACTGQVTYATAYSLNTCIPQDGVTVRFSCSNVDPVANVFFTPNCTGDPFPLALSDTCGPSSGGSDDDYTPPFITSPDKKQRSLAEDTGALASTTVTYSGLNYCPARAPTLSPVHAPTAYPTTSAAVLVEFDVTQGLSGITAETFNNDASDDNNLNTMKTTIAQSMTGTSSSNILSLTVVTNLNRRLQGSAVSALNAAVSTSTMSYTVSVTTTMSAAQLFSQLQSVITSGAFTSALYTNANANGATDLIGVTSNSVVMGSNTPTGDDDTTTPSGDGGDDDDSLSTQDVIFIAVGCGVGGALIAAFVVYWLMSRRSSPMASQHGGDSSA